MTYYILKVSPFLFESNPALKEKFEMIELMKFETEKEAYDLLIKTFGSGIISPPMKYISIQKVV